MTPVCSKASWSALSGKSLSPLLLPLPHSLPYEPITRDNSTAVTLGCFYSSPKHNLLDVVDNQSTSLYQKPATGHLPPVSCVRADPPTK